MTLSASELTKRYGDGIGYEAVRDASLKLDTGEFISIVGRSGSGKSTLLAMLGALTRPSSGELQLDGADVWSFSEARLSEFRCRHIGFVFQFPSLLSNLTVLDNVAAPALLGHTMTPEAAHARAADLLDRVGLAARINAYPSTMSGGEQRRVVIVRALINSPRLLLADEPTSDLDQSTEADIIDLLLQFQVSEAFSFVLVTHDLDLAYRAPRIYEMRQGVLSSIETPLATVTAQSQPYRIRHEIAPLPLERAASAVAPDPIPLGRDLWRGVQTAALIGAAVFGIFLVADFAVGRYQNAVMERRSAQAAALTELALDSLRGDIEQIADLGGGQYDLTISLENVGGGATIYVMSPDMRAYVQVGREWHELPITAVDAAADEVLKIDGKQDYRYRFEAHPTQYAQLLPNYMHVRFADTMLVSPSSKPHGDVFDRRDNYYVYLKPSGVRDDVILKRIHFPGKPPVWIPMPPH
jgi:putative ABC transport system ATP-binding protein/macrolide transport system ATP-binding/permease protein/lipoprotein-releasing system ATP-binding protein